MTADIRTAAEAVPVFRFTNTQWREYQQIPDQGYSHRHWIEHQVNEWAARVTPTQEQIAMTVAQFFGPGDTPEDVADAVLTLIANQTATKS